MAQHRELKDVEKGDRVWVGNAANPRRSLLTVTKLTPKQIVTDGAGWRFRRDNFRSIGTSASGRITGIATSEEVAAWDAERQSARQKAAERNAERERITAKRRELTALFGRNAYVGESDDAEKGEWAVWLYLSEEGVRRLAELRSDSPSGKPDN